MIWAGVSEVNKIVQGSEMPPVLHAICFLCPNITKLSIFSFPHSDEDDAEAQCLHAVVEATKADESNPMAWLSTANFRTVKKETEVGF